MISRLKDSHRARLVSLQVSAISALVFLLPAAEASARTTSRF